MILARQNLTNWTSFAINFHNAIIFPRRVVARSNTWVNFVNVITYIRATINNILTCLHMQTCNTIYITRKFEERNIYHCVILVREKLGKFVKLAENIGCLHSLDWTLSKIKSLLLYHQYHLWFVCTMHETSLFSEPQCLSNTLASNFYIIYA